MWACTIQVVLYSKALMLPSPQVPVRWRARLLQQLGQVQLRRRGGKEGILSQVGPFIQCSPLKDYTFSEFTFNKAHFLEPFFPIELKLGNQSRRQKCCIRDLWAIVGLFIDYLIAHLLSKNPLK